MHLPNLTRHATDAIIAQIRFAANDEATKCAAVDGAEVEFTVHYSTEWDRSRDDYGCMGNVASCEITGAWIADPDTGDATWAGNKAELEALIGEKLVWQWEAAISQDETDGGKW